MPSRLKKRVVSLEAKAASAAPTGVFHGVGVTPESIDALRQNFLVVRTEHKRRSSLPVVDQLRLARNDLENLLGEREQGARTTSVGAAPVEEGLLQLKEKFKRCWILKLEADLKQGS